MEIRSPLDMPQTPPFGPPIVPGLTELPPHKMRAVLRGIGGDDEEETGDEDENLSPAELLAQVGKLAYIAAQFGPELLNLVIAAVNAVKTGIVTTEAEMAPSPMMADPMAGPMPGPMPGPMDAGLEPPPMPPPSPNLPQTASSPPEKKPPTEKKPPPR